MGQYWKQFYLRARRPRRSRSGSKASRSFVLRNRACRNKFTSTPNIQKLLEDVHSPLTGVVGGGCVRQWGVNHYTGRVRRFAVPIFGISSLTLTNVSRICVASASTANLIAGVTCHGRTSSLTTLPPDFQDPSPTTSQLFSMLSFNPFLQELYLVQYVVLASPSKCRSPAWMKWIPATRLRPSPIRPPHE